MLQAQLEKVASTSCSVATIGARSSFSGARLAHEFPRSFLVAAIIFPHTKWLKKITDYRDTPALNDQWAQYHCFSVEELTSSTSLCAHDMQGLGKFLQEKVKFRDKKKRIMENMKGSLLSGSFNHIPLHFSNKDRRTDSWIRGKDTAQHRRGIEPRVHPTNIRTL